MANQSLSIPYITLSGVIVVAIVISFTIFQPMMRTISVIRAETAQNEITLREKETFLRNLDIKSKELQIQRVHEDRLNVMFPTDEAYDDAIRVIASAAEGAGASVQKVSNKTGSVQGNLNARRARGEAVDIPETVNVLGADIDIISTYQQFRAFLTNLEASPRLVDVVEVSVSRVQDKPDVLSTRASLQFYYRNK